MQWQYSQLPNARYFREVVFPESEIRNRPKMDHSHWIASSGKQGSNFKLQMVLASSRSRHGGRWYTGETSYIFLIYLLRF